MSAARLKERLLQAEAERDYYRSLVESFFSGEVPEVGNSRQHIIIAQWGRKRLEAMRAKPALLQPGE